MSGLDIFPGTKDLLLGTGQCAAVVLRVGIGALPIPTDFLPLSNIGSFMIGY